MFKKVNTTGRPVISLKWNGLDVFLESISVLTLLLIGIYTLTVYSDLPDQIPMHFNGDGIADDFGSKQSIWFLWSIGFALYILLTLIKNPHQFNYTVKITEHNAAYQYTLSVRLIRWVKFILLLAFTLLQYSIIDAAITGKGAIGSHLLALFVIGPIVPLVVYFQLATKQR